MRCSLVRECLSALADDEAIPVDRDLLAAHLRGCAGCAAYDVSLRSLARVVVAAAEPVPDLTQEILRARVRHHTHYAWWRVALVVVAALQVGVVLAAVAHLGHAADHADRELAAFDVALAVGFLVAAWRPGSARGLAPLVGCLTVLLGVSAGYDIASGATSPADELPHLVVLLGFVLTWLLRPRPPRAVRRELHLAACDPAA